MNPEKMVELQMQIRQNNDEMINSMSDLNSWEEEIKAKEKALISGDKPKKPFPIRNSLIKKIKKDVIKQKDEASKNEANKIKGSDYQTWDHFDAKSACEEIEKNDKEKEERALKIANEVIEQAEKIKEEGNSHFKAGRYKESIESYSRAIQLTPQNPLLFSNRALAHIKLQNWVEAEKDCDSALKIDGVLVKGLMRRGLVRREVGRLKEAQDDFEKVLKVEPTNRQSKEELVKIQELIGTQAIRASQADDKRPGVVKAIYKAPHERSQKPLRRVKIVEVGVDKRDLPSEHQKPTIDQNFDSLLSKITDDTINEMTNKKDNFKDANTGHGSDKVKRETGGGDDVTDDDADDGTSLLNDKLIIPSKASNKGGVKIVELDSSLNNDGGVEGGIINNSNNNNKKGDPKASKVPKKDASADKKAKTTSSSPTIPTAPPSNHSKSSFSSLTSLPSSSLTASSAKKFSQLEPGPPSSVLKSTEGSVVAASDTATSSVSVSSFQFQMDWRDLKDDDEGFFKYLKSLDPSSFRVMFGEFLDSAILSKIIHTLQKYYLKSHPPHILEN